MRGKITWIYEKAEIIIFKYLSNGISWEHPWKYSFSTRPNDRKGSSPNLNLSFWKKLDTVALRFGLSFQFDKNGKRLESSSSVVHTPEWLINSLLYNPSYALQRFWRVRRLPSLSDIYWICNFAIFRCTASSIAYLRRFERLTYTVSIILSDVSYKLA